MNPTGLGLSINTYDQFGDFLFDYLKARKSHNEKFSNRCFAKKIGLSSGYLTMICQGKRLPSSQVLAKIVGEMNLSSLEDEQLGALLDLSRTKDERTKRKIRRKLKAGVVAKDRILKNGELNLLDPWYNTAILELTALADFKLDPAWIAKKLNGRITVEQAFDSLKKLKELGFIQTDGNNWTRSDEGYRTTHDIPTKAIRDFHQSMLKEASRAIRLQPTSQRLNAGTMMAVSADDIADAKKELMRFRDEFKERFGSKKGEKLYYVSVQFFCI